MARGGYRMWAQTDRFQADYDLRRCRQALQIAKQQNAPARVIERIEQAEARFRQEVQRVEASIGLIHRTCSICGERTGEAVQPGSMGDYHESCMRQSLAADEVLWEAA